MGYRCPHCKIDFGHDRYAFQHHLSNNVGCAITAISTLHDRLAISVDEDKEFSLEDTEEGGEEGGEE